MPSPASRALTCFRPLKAFRLGEGPLVFGGSPVGGEDHFSVSCGRCIGCRRRRTRSWATRAVHESQMCDERSCFVTLTYSPEHLPEDQSLDVSVWQKFMKRLRKRFGPGVKYLHCGEYGSLGRPHYHALLFGVDFAFDRIPLKRSSSGAQLFVSPTLQSLWKFGFSSLGLVSFQSASYVAKYCIKSLTVEDDGLLKRVDKRTGEVLDVKPEYATMSRRPGLGRTWFDAFYRDVYPADFCVVDGKKLPPPQFYDRLLAELEPDLWERVRQARVERGEEFEWNSTDDRLRTREKVAMAEACALRPDGLE